MTRDGNAFDDYDFCDTIKKMGDEQLMRLHADIGDELASRYRAAKLAQQQRALDLAGKQQSSNDGSK